MAGGKQRRTIKVQLVKTQGCGHCTQVIEILKKIKPDYPGLTIEEILMTTEKGMTLVQNHGIMASPGVIINGKLAFVGGASEGELRKKLDDYKNK